MISVFEERRRLIGVGLYHVVTWYALGVPVYRRWKALTTTQPTASEERG